jgi:hypothetical protein
MKISLASKFSLLIPDIVLRAVILIIQFALTLAEVHIPPYILAFVHIMTLMIFIYLVKRRAKGIRGYIITRSQSYSKFNAFKKKVECDISGDYGLFYFISVISCLFITVSMILPWIGDDRGGYDLTLSFTMLGSFIGSWVFLRFNRSHFISSEIVAVEIDKVKVSHIEFVDYQKFLDKKSDEQADHLHFKNDEWIIDVDRKIKEYRLRAETFLIESVFLGALTFSAFLAIVGPESSEEMRKAGGASANQINLHDRMEVLINKFQNMEFSHLINPDTNQTDLYLLIAVGSIICSVFYIAVLVKRYPIIKSIEHLNAGLERAKVWNNREEEILRAEIQTSHIATQNSIKLLNSKRELYSDRIQSELANCEQSRVEIETKVRLISIIRNIGLYIFFGVLFIGSLIVHPMLCLVLVTILIYAIITAKIIDYDFGHLFENKATSGIRSAFNKNDQMKF